jgi:hypothetical protein
VERHSTAPPSKKPLPSALKQQPRVPLSLQSVFLEAQRNGMAKIPPPSQIAFFTRRWESPNFEKKVKKGTPGLKFGIDQKQPYEIRKKTPTFVEYEDDINEDIPKIIRIGENRWTEGSCIKSVAPPRSTKSFFHSALECSKTDDANRWKESSHMKSRAPPKAPRRRSE